MRAIFIAVPLMALLCGSIVYCVLTVIAAARFLRSGAAIPRRCPPVSVLRPLAGAEDNTAANLRSLFEQRYDEFEVLLSVHDEADPAAAIAREVMAQYPGIPSRLIVAGVSPFPNAKVWCLRALMREASHEVIVMSDSDIRIGPGGLATVIAELEEPNVGLVTCPYRASGGPRLWSKIEALGLNTEFIGGMLTARMLGGMDFAIGCTIATRRADLADIGGLEHLQRYLAEDFVMGNLMYRLGKTVVLSRCVIDHYIGNDGFLKNWKHRLRWARSTRRSRRIGYLGEIFTKTTALALMLWMVAPTVWGLVVLALSVRAAAQWATAIQVLGDTLVARDWWLLPLEDLASFVTWVLGFFG
ncbi:MAG: bacteriohopanetetrol glucosamine biosynthesis glycosyltransferase HpnI, partial [Acidobacteriota bacterium]|nr:bacteriohopanetetrol glucosamine biosynthesis glycosyltransferase HpnI [Acidobacteriota bacterium]